MLTLKDQKLYRPVKQYGEWLILGKYGQVSLYSDGDLDVWITSVKKANKAALIWPPKSTYDDGACFVRPASDLKLAGQMIKAKKKRQVTEAMRQRGRELMARMRSGKEKARLEATKSNEKPGQGE